MFLWELRLYFYNRSCFRRMWIAVGKLEVGNFVFVVNTVERYQVYYVQLNSFGARFQTTFFVCFYLINNRSERSFYVELKHWTSNCVNADKKPSRLDLCCFQKLIIIACASERVKYEYNYRSLRVHVGLFPPCYIKTYVRSHVITNILANTLNNTNLAVGNPSNMHMM